jgi:hypothetical protein
MDSGLVSPKRRDVVSALETWRRGAGLSYAELSARLGTKGEQTVWRYCLPIGHKAARIPRPEIMRRIYVLTAGVVRPDHFYDLPDLALAA